MQIHRGRLIDHVHLVVEDLGAALRFYSAVFEVLGIPISSKADDHFYADELFVSTATSKAASKALTGRHHLAFQAPDRATVERFHAAAVAAGGQDNGAPGERPYHPGYYAAFVLDPAGNNIEAVFHGPAKFSAKSVVIDIGTPGQ
ncbi:MAG: VOC family protein [Kofleriaceae bacterium]